MCLEMIQHRGHFIGGNAKFGCPMATAPVGLTSHIYRAQTTVSIASAADLDTMLPSHACPAAGADKVKQ